MDLINFGLQTPIDMLPYMTRAPSKHRFNVGDKVIIIHPDLAEERRTKFSLKGPSHDCETLHGNIVTIQKLCFYSGGKPLYYNTREGSSGVWEHEVDVI